MCGLLCLLQTPHCSINYTKRYCRYLKRSRTTLKLKSYESSTLTAAARLLQTSAHLLSYTIRSVWILKKKRSSYDYMNQQACCAMKYVQVLYHFFPSCRSAISPFLYNLSIYQYINLSIYLFDYLFNNLLIYLFIYLFIYLSIYDFTTCRGDDNNLLSGANCWRNWKQHSCSRGRVKILTECRQWYNTCAQFVLSENRPGSAPLYEYQ